MKTTSGHQMVHAFPLFYSFEQLYFFISNVCVHLQGAPQGILVFLLDKIIGKDRTHSVQAARQAHKTSSNRWKNVLALSFNFFKV